MNWPVPVCPFRCWSVWPFRRRWPVCVVGRPWTASRDECRGEPAPEGQLSRPPATMTDGRRSGSVYRPPALRPTEHSSASYCCYRPLPLTLRWRCRQWGGYSQRTYIEPSETSVYFEIWWGKKYWIELRFFFVAKSLIYSAQQSIKGNHEIDFNIYILNSIQWDQNRIILILYWIMSVLSYQRISVLLSVKMD